MIDIEYVHPASQSKVSRVFFYLCLTIC